MDMKDGNEDFELVQELIGVGEARKLAEAFGGSTIYIPKIDRVTERHQSIKQEFRNGANYRELSVKYGYTQNHIRRIVHKK
jgi:Mor family transcriptional regulator